MTRRGLTQEQLLGEAGPHEAERRGWVGESLAALAIGVLVMMVFLAASGCTHRRPNTVPSKPPAVTPPASDTASPTIAWGLVRTNGAAFIDTSTGQPITDPGAILCCPEQAPPGWPMVNRAAIDSLPANIAFVHVRPGPFLRAAESEYAQLGGGYVEIDGKADLDHWNEPFWKALDDACIYAGQQHKRVQVSILDGWYCKEGNDPSVPFPWHYLHNIQGEHVIADCGQTLSPRQQAWVRKVVQTVGRHANVIWESSNEEFGIPGYSPAWTFAMRKLVQQIELSAGYPVHVFGAQSESDVTQAGDVDYNSQHWAAPAPAPLFGKPTIVNEYNPNPPYSAEVMRSLYCTARANGTYWWLWRHGQSADEWARTLALVAQGCEGVPIGGCPAEVRPTRSISCKIHGDNGTEQLLDCTPIADSGGPLWPEGNGEIRLACETLSMCREARGEACIDFRLVDVTGDLRLVGIAHNGYAPVLAGHGTARLQCRIPAADAHFRGCILSDGTNRVSR